VPLRPLYSQKQDINCCQSERLGLDEQIWSQKVNQETGALASIDHSLRLHSPAAAATAVSSGLRVIASVAVWYASANSFLAPCSPAELQSAVSREFEFYQATGKDGKGNVLFTAFMSHLYQPCRRYPLYRLPPNFSWLSRILPRSSWKERMVC